MFARHNNSFVLVALFLAAACYFCFTVSAETPSAGKTKKAVEAADAATKKAQAAGKAATDAAVAAFFTEYPENEDGSAARAADEDADVADQAAAEAEKAAAEAREKACRSGKTEDKKAAEEAEKRSAELEANADKWDAEANKADRKADPHGKQLQKKKRDAARAARAAYRQARAAICFALQCAQLMDESSESNKEKKEDTIETIDGLDSSVDNLLVAVRQDNRGKVEKGNPSTASPSTGSKPNRATKASVVTANGLHTITVNTIHGNVIAKVTDDARAGDTISGTVVAEATGKTAEERKANEAKLSELKLNFGSRFPKDKKELMIFITPRVIIQDEESSGASSSNPTNFTTKLPDTFDYTIGVNAPRTDTETVTITVASPIWFINNQPTTPPRTEPPPSPNDFLFQDIIQQGRTGQITGRDGMKVSDGNSANTRLMYGPLGSTVQDFEKNTENVAGGYGLIQPLAESPRKFVFQAPTTIARPVQLYLKKGNLETVAPANVLGINLSGKTNLSRNEHTDLKIDVFGLQGIRKSIPSTLEAQGVIRLEGGNYQQFTIQPSQVDPQGHYIRTVGGTGVEVGTWSATVTVVNDKFNVCLQDDGTPARVMLWNSFTGDYIFTNPVPPPQPKPPGGTVQPGDPTQSGGATVTPSNVTTPTGINLTGTGKPLLKGCIITLTHDAPDRRVFARLDACTKTGDATIQTSAPKTTFTIHDTSAFATCP